MANIYGGSGNDTLNGNSEDDQISARDGNDSVDAGGGDDTVYGGSGNDTLEGGSGRDMLYGGSGTDTLYGGTSRDTLSGDGGADLVYGGDSNDSLVGGQGNDLLSGGQGDDWITGDGIYYMLSDYYSKSGGTAVNLTVTNTSGGTIYLTHIGHSGENTAVATLSPGQTYVLATTDTQSYMLRDADNFFLQVIPAGPSQTVTYATEGLNDTLYGDDGNDTMLGQFGSDTLYGGTGTDTLYGGSGNDSLLGGNDRDTLYGGTGDDTMSAGSGNDLIYGGDGNDIIGGWSIDDSGDDTMYGDAGNDSIVGGGGNDTVYGGTGNDTLSGQTGADTLFGGDGADAFYITEDHDADTIFGGEGGIDIDTLDVGTYLSTFGFTVEFTGSEAGTYWTPGGTAAGSFSQIEAIDGTGYSDLFDASSSSVTQTLFGNSGADSLIGGTAADRIFGGDGNDTIEGGLGADTLSGGAGDDTFVLTQSGGADVISDFYAVDDDASGKFEDQIDASDLRTLGGDPVTAWDVTVEDDGFGNALLTFPEGETLVLQGVTPAQMTGAQNLYRAGIPCFTEGTMILTPRGEVPVETLRPGDRVVTRDNGPQELLWTGQRRLCRHELERNPALLPVRIAPGGWAGERGIMVSPQHGLVARGTGNGDTDILVRAAHLARLRGGKARVAQGIRQVCYVHLLFGDHQVIWSNGIASESFYPGTWGIRSLSQGPLLEVLRLFPELARLPAAAGYGPSARPYSRFGHLPEHAADLVSDLR